MDLLDTKTDEELIKSLLAEAAKARNELKCAQADIDKAQNRLAFVIMLTNNLIKRQEK